MKADPAELRTMIRKGDWDKPTTGLAPGYVQANLVMLPRQEAFHFLLFCVRNPKPCPILDVLEPGQPEPVIARGADLRADLPKYRVYEQGILKSEPTDVTSLFREETVSFLLGCSFSFEAAMLAAGLPVRNMEEGKNVSMFVTNRPCVPAGPFSCPMVVSMRPMTPEQAVRAVQVTTRFHLTHGAPVHIGSPEALGIQDLNKPDFGDPVRIHQNEVPVFWACGVTSTLAALIVGISLIVNAEETVCVIGANGSGKSTILRAVMGAQPVFEGRISFRGQEIHKLRTEQIVRLGIIYVPEEKMLFTPLSVEENLLLGAYILKDESRIRKNLDFVYNLFVPLRNRRFQAASTLSGGEQQMVAIGRGLMSNPSILMLDEPSLGLAPILVDEVLDTVRRLKEQGMTILLVEQNVREALDLADRAYLIRTGRMVTQGTGKKLLEDDLFRTAFLGL